MLKQAESIGLSDIEAYRSLQKQLETIENSTDDPVGDQDIHLDYAIDELMQEMSKKLEMKLQELYKIKSRTKLGLVKEKGMVLFEVEGEDE